MTRTEVKPAAEDRQEDDMRTRLLILLSASIAACDTAESPANNSAASNGQAAAPPANAQQAQASEWQHLGADPDRNVGFGYDPRSVQRNGDVVRFRYREDHSQRRPPTEESEFIVETEVNCASGTARELTIETRRRDGNVERSTEPTEFSPIDPNSPLEYIRGVVCGAG